MKLNNLNNLNNGNTTISNPQGTVKPRVKDVTNTNYLYWLGGFVEGEGCTSISVIASASAPFGILLQPIFNVTQHVNGIAILESFLDLFGRGNLHAKSGSDNVWVYDLKGYKHMINLVIPFYLEYVLSFGCKIPEFEMAHSICIMLQDGQHMTKEGLISMVRLVYTVQGKGKWRKRTLEDVIRIIEESPERVGKPKPTRQLHSDGKGNNTPQRLNAIRLIS